MSIVMTATARVKDWHALEQASRERLIETAQAVGATRYGTYRNIYDASQVLVLVEVPDHQAAWELGQALYHILDLVHRDEAPREQAWEAMDWLHIGS